MNTIITFSFSYKNVGYKNCRLKFPIFTARPKAQRCQVTPYVVNVLVVLLLLLVVGGGSDS